MTNKILLVEDEDALSSYLIPELKFEDYQVLLAQDGLEALQLYDNNRGNLDLIILDWMLPKLDGLEVLRRIRKNDDIPIIMMTARDYVGDKVAGLDSGADDYITKPFEIEELLARIRVMLRHENRHPQQNQLYTLEDLSLDTKSRQVSRGNQLIQLTQREYELLLTLIQHAGETLTRDELLDTVWGVDFEGQPNVVDVYIRYLRNKVDRAYPKQLIHTVRGVGYVLSGNYQE
ncbi:Response regulator MprA [Lentilactobacillus parabuchneri]|uniref:Response regulator MprA n=3 Tax=Lentilactobacillus TaxID=2767893 RepID=A0A1X1FDZ9_9LACO|nr:response regulator transcription factor [Lentilactobacillus parabuchneri]APR07817.1 Response regulator MprA [Lentilactobacillus parabuchneri]MBW0222213.1 response regulator transcription factor [Lentilactobacillus parabuchneri]MBW0245550.1 response regulator transcription factor [Lentilactobacillus parabuchneri]MBW0263618.1 response regulator transcription factor [Lentilactobacillus parabuchneri]MCT2884175.1 DNA-binding response regulator [Lentilactobacillus parabuchneri]